MSGDVVLTEDLEILWASLDVGANSGGQAETVPTDGAAMRSLGVDDAGVADAET